MIQALKTAIQWVSLAVLAVVAVTSAQAQYAPLGGVYASGDAVAGFTKGSGNDVIVNLGLISSLTNGEQWNLNALLTASTNFTSLNNLKWGVIGISSGSYYATGAYNTAQTGNNQAIGELKTMFDNNTPPINSQGIEIDPASGESSWYNCVDTVGNPDTTTPANLLGVGIDTTTTGSGSFTFAQDSVTWYYSHSPSGGATTNYFALNSSGILLFTNVVVSSGPPAPKIVAVTRVNTTTTIYFTTTNSFTYSLYYTNSAGLTTPTANWPSSFTTVSGNGLTNSLSDTTTDINRFYRIGVH